MKKISIYVDENIYKQLEELASKQGRHTSELMRESFVKILKDYAVSNKDN